MKCWDQKRFHQDPEKVRGRNPVEAMRRERGGGFNATYVNGL